MDFTILLLIVVKTPSALESGSLEGTKGLPIRLKDHRRVAGERKETKVKEKEAEPISLRAGVSRRRGEAKEVSKEVGSQRSRITMVLTGTNGILPANGRLETNPVSSGILGVNWTRPLRMDREKETAKERIKAARVEAIKSKCLPVANGVAILGKITLTASIALALASSSKEAEMGTNPPTTLLRFQD